MGACVSTSNQNSHSRRNIGEPIIPHLATDFSGQKRSRGKLVEHQVSNLLQHLPSVPGRIFGNGKTKSSCLFTQQGCKGINQDAMIVWEDFIGEDVTFCGVFDGHGPHGHLVAHSVRDALPVKLLSFLHSYKSLKDEPGVSCFRRGLKKTDKVKSADDSILEDRSSMLWREVFLKSYKSMDKELRSQPNLDCFCSGSTAITLVKQGCNLFLGYIGDSRAVLGSKDSNDAMEAIQLTVDLKPSLPKEAERINRCKGRVFALQDEPEVARVWLPFDDAPGLAMARAFGDFCLKQYGVISIPEFSHRTLTERDQFIVLASDGIWDVLSNQEVVNIIASAPTRSSAARLLVDSAANQWKLKYPTSKMDDCAVVCLFLDGIVDSEPNHNEQVVSSATLRSIYLENAVESEDGKVIEPIFQRNTTVRSAEENKAYRNLGNEVDENQHWTGLEGVTRVNSLVQLPRFSNDRVDL